MSLLSETLSFSALRLAFFCSRLRSFSKKSEKRLECYEGEVVFLLCRARNRSFFSCGGRISGRGLEG
ncbi:unnamed protein product [Victoria cruziana]